MEPIPAMTKLRRWRLENEFTLDDEAGLTGLSKAYLSRLERGERAAPPSTKVIIARRLGASVEELFEVERVPEPAP